MTQSATRAAPAIATLAMGLAALLLPACSVRPTYQVRVENTSSRTIVAQIRRDRTLDSDEILAQARIRPNQEATLGPATADPFDRVDLLVARPEDLQSLPMETRLSRGNWQAAVTDAPISTWHQFSVQLTKE